MRLELIGQLVVGYALGVGFVYGGGVYLLRAIRKDYENLTFSRFRYVMSPLGLSDNQRALRLFWIVGGPLCMVAGALYLAQITWLLLT